jgi:3-oxoacyl-[acyl-carrier protein] reductase
MRLNKGIVVDLGLQGKWALVCGASKGLGFGCAQALAAQGVNLVIVARGAQALAQAELRLVAEQMHRQSQEFGYDLEGIPMVISVAADITTPEGREAALSVAGGPGRDFDIVVTNAGGPPTGDFRDWDRDTWLKAVEANMLTPIELMKATVDGMAERGFGRIINITSSAVKAPIDILGLSNGARSGLTGFVAGLARNPQLAARGVTINNLLPGAFDTDRLHATLQGAATKTGQSLDTVTQQRRHAIPARRFGTAAEFGQTCAFLCSVHAGYITGQNILIDGGAYPGVN